MLGTTSHSAQRRVYEVIGFGRALTDTGTDPRQRIPKPQAKRRDKAWDLRQQSKEAKGDITYANRSWKENASTK